MPQLQDLSSTGLLFCVIRFLTGEHCRTVMPPLTGLQYSTSVALGPCCCKYDMLPSLLQFAPLARPPSRKTLLDWHKNAGWSAPITQRLDQHPGAEVVWVGVKTGKKRVGIARLELAAPEFCYVADLIISSEYRRHGIGTWFLQAIEQFCIARGIKRLLLQPQAGTEMFYKARYFVTDPHVPAFLKKDLNPFLGKRFMPLTK